MILPPVEPSAEPWQVRALDRLLADLLPGLMPDQMSDEPGAQPARGTVVLAVDGRSASGKSTFAARVVAAVPGAAVVHTDDVAWYESFFGWDGLLAEHVLAPVRRGEPVSWRPPAWDARERPGAIEVPGGAPLLVVEGVGASRRSLAALLDHAIWVQADVSLARDRGLLRDLADRPDPREAERFWDEWDAQETAFLAEDRPWERADLVVCGTPDLELAAGQVAVGRGPG